MANKSQSQMIHHTADALETIYKEIVEIIRKSADVEQTDALGAIREAEEFGRRVNKMATALMTDAFVPDNVKSCALTHLLDILIAIHDSL